MNPAQKRQTIKELNERARQQRIAEDASGEQVEHRSVYAWVGNDLVLMPEAVAKQYGHKY